LKERLLQYLACSACRGEFRLEGVEERDGIEIIRATLQCASCVTSIPVVRGVPRFADLSQIEPEKAATAASFGWEWQHFTQEDKRYAEQMLAWLDPVTEDFFRDKVVLEGGCGKGRHTLLAARWGARDVVSVDLSDAVESAFAATRGSSNMHIVQADLCNLPLARVFDYAFSIGVLHHMPDPLAGFKSLASKIKSGGHFSVWVYGAENNAWITGIVSPLREGITSRINRRALLHLSKLPTAAVYAVTKLLFGPLNKTQRGSALARKLFYGEYLSAIAGFGWREHHTIVFDHLVAPTAHYVSGEEFRRWWDEIGAKETVIGWHNKMSWRGFGRTGNNEHK
jgi:SAM-dependent methyltransferase